MAAPALCLHDGAAMLACPVWKSQQFLEMKTSRQASTAKPRAT